MFSLWLYISAIGLSFVGSSSLSFRSRINKNEKTLTSTILFMSYSFLPTAEPHYRWTSIAFMAEELEFETPGPGNMIPMLSPNISDAPFFPSVLNILVHRRTCGHWKVLYCYWIWGLVKKNRLPEAVLCPVAARKDLTCHHISPLHLFFLGYLTLPFPYPVFRFYYSV